MKDEKSGKPKNLSRGLGRKRFDHIETPGLTTLIVITIAGPILGFYGYLLPIHYFTLIVIARSECSRTTRQSVLFIWRKKFAPSDVIFSMTLTVNDDSEISINNRTVTKVFL